MKRAALYLRSSKDRKDVSIHHQRAELTALAEARGLMVTSEFTDVVESGKSEFRPGFQALGSALRAPSRDWDTILILDTSRLGRRRYIGEAFKHECAKRGVSVIFKSLPEVDPISKVILESVMGAMDEVHSLMSRDKGLAGMAQNIEQGFRAGGRAPRGYRLRRIDTGHVRDGQPITKSVLEPNEEAERVAQFLKLRAQQVSRTQAARQAGIDWPATSLIGMEWGALTYAGHSVWNVHSEKRPDGGYVGGRKRRPRSDWHVREDTHPALITQEEAEQILHSLETSDTGRAVSAAKSGNSPYLLTGLLQAPDGRPWIGQRGRFYRLKASARGKGRQIQCAELDKTILARVRTEFSRDTFLSQLLDAAKEQAEQAPERLQALEREIRDISRQIDRAVELAMEMAEPSALLRKADALEARRREMNTDRENEKAARDAQRALAAITKEDLATILGDLLQQIDDTPALKQFLASVIDRIELHPGTLECAIHYRIPVRLCMASPRGHASWTPVRVRTQGHMRAA